MVEHARTIDEIVSSIIHTEAFRDPRMRGMMGLLAGSALAFGALLVAEFYSYPLPEFLSMFEAIGSPYRILLVITLLVEGLLSVWLLNRHKEENYPSLSRNVSTSMAAVGALFAATGFVLYLYWTGVVVKYDANQLLPAHLGALLLLIGGAALLCALPPVATSSVRELVSGDDV